MFTTGFGCTTKKGFKSFSTTFTIALYCTKPVVNKTLQINFERLQGDYHLKLIAKQGAIIFITQINISSAKEMKNILLSDAVAAGVYELVLEDGMGKKLLQTVIIK